MGTRAIEIDSEIADWLEREARTRGLSLSDLLADLARRDPDPLPGDLEAMRADGRGPWAVEAMAEDARAIADFEKTGEGVPFDEIAAWIDSRGAPSERPVPKSRRLRRLSFRRGQRPISSVYAHSWLRRI